MKRSLLLLVALACTGAVAQEKQVWACQQEEGTMLNYRNGRWEQSLIVPEALLLTIDGANSRVKEGEAERRLSCSKVDFWPEISCLTSIKDKHYYFSPDTGRLGVSSLIGATLTGDRRDSVSAKIYNCTKF